MLFLLDANVLIDANRDYYPIDSVPEFWDWLLFMSDEGKVKIPIEIYEELTNGSDDLAGWLKRPEIKNMLLLDEAAEVELVRQVISNGYATDLDDTEIEALGRDPFLISYALNSGEKNNRCIVTTEISKPSRKRANRRIPDVCNSLTIHCCNSFDFYKALNFKTHWRENL